MPNDYYMVSSLFSLVLAALLGFWAWYCFRRYQKLDGILKREPEMTETADGTISELVTVRRRNRSFRWNNQYPVISYRVNGQEYQIRMEYAEKRAGKYRAGGSYRVRYVPGEPGCGMADFFKKNMANSRRNNLIGTLVLALLTCNLLVSVISGLIKLVA